MNMVDWRGEERGRHLGLDIFAFLVGEGIGFFCLSILNKSICPSVDLSPLYLRGGVLLLVSCHFIIHDIATIVVSIELRLGYID